MSARSTVPVRGAPHGTTNGYNNHGCGCSRCRAAWAKYYRDRRRAKREAKEE